VAHSGPFPSSRPPIVRSTKTYPGDRHRAAHAAGDPRPGRALRRADYPTRASLIAFSGHAATHFPHASQNEALGV
jgi:hypothetical protein